MKRKNAIVALVIVCVVMIAGLVMGILVGPNWETEMKERYVVTITAGHVIFELEDVEAAFAKAGADDANVRLAGTAIGDRAVVTFEKNFGKMDDVMRTLHETYPNAEAGSVERLSAAQNVQPEIWMALIPCGVMLLVAFLYGMIRYDGFSGGLQLLCGLFVDMALPLALAMLIRLPLPYGFAGMVALFGVVSLLLRTDYLNRLTGALRARGKKQRDGNEIAGELLRANKVKILLTVLSAAVLLLAIGLLSASGPVMQFMLFGLLGMATLLLGQLLNPAYYALFGDR